MAAESGPSGATRSMATQQCPCGYAGDVSGRCCCASTDISRYRSRLSGPLADRIDLHVTVPGISLAQLGNAASREDSATVRARVEAARGNQQRRYARMAGSVWNGGIPGRWLDRHGGAHPEAKALLARAAERLGISARAYHRVLRVARTIADLDGVSGIGASHVAEALRYRPGDGPGGAQVS